MPNVLETERLILSEFTTADAAFVLELLNDPTWLQNIGDRGVRTLDDARAYIKNGPISSYKRFGLGLYLVRLKEGNIPVGVCGLLKREVLEDFDIGYALLPRYTGMGYAQEAAAGVVRHARHTLGLARIVAFTLPGNPGSIRVLEKLGMKYEGTMQLTPDADVCNLYVLEL
ncbi:GNAT family N-acetyltransferase [Pontibacter akesuensis]|uniref:Protein N-acetyltransferase, RimJ/RimL family n=1 Tax=Pontibacter akesuensis TaxID=388950 RepID=A0A1I7KXR0_9BACT|nr:GNAT family N-acetyltransferase [Pontibacter akesuensis]GHA78550.1 N-acetyltransferase GCN5 [Pontibacter akesuensis]SFV02096.1 Protein N-acetyltransferase, RimJ/RimL family [Pontibacter akesuensis]